MICHNPQLVNAYGCFLDEDVKVGSFVEIGPRVVFGAGTNISCFCFIPEGVAIKKNCFIGPRVTFLNDKYAPSHGKWREEDSYTVVEDNVSIGGGAVILPGVVLGKGCRIGAGAIVTRSVPAGMTVVGNPARNILYSHPKWEDGYEKTTGSN